MRRAGLLAVMLAVCLVSGARAQDAPAGTDKPSPMDKATADAADSVRKEKADELRIAMPDSPSAVVLSDPATRLRYLEAMQQYYQYRTNGYAYRSRVFEWQLLSSRGIFVVVLVLVGCGIYFAWVQFRAALLAVAHGGPAATSPEPNPFATQLEISAKGIVLNSSILGVIILSLSLAFFYLYLVYVYPIQNVF